jgi:hypothetical protein
MTLLGYTSCNYLWQDGEMLYHCQQGPQSSSYHFDIFVRNGWHSLWTPSSAIALARMVGIDLDDGWDMIVSEIIENVNRDALEANPTAYFVRAML